jgi:DNA-nicking Smr family endonuclease
VPRNTLADEQEVLDEMLHGGPDPVDVEIGDELLYRAPGLQDRVFRKLRRGHYVVEGELDLHGLTAEEAHKAVSGFIAAARRSGRRCVRIIHGKGLGSRQGKPVLKTRLNYWLRQRKDVLAFCPARASDGGTGAAYVLIRSSR